jgi:hypothetical protein
MTRSLPKHGILTRPAAHGGQDVLVATAPVSMDVSGNDLVWVSDADLAHMIEYRVRPGLSWNATISSWEACTFAKLSQYCRYGNELLPGSGKAVALLGLAESYIGNYMAQVGVSIRYDHYLTARAGLKPLLDALKPKRSRVVIKVLEDAP